MIVRGRGLLLLMVGAMLAIGSMAVADEDEAAGNWSRWRGRNAAGRGGDGFFPVAWSADGWAWKADLPGVGHASPVIWKDHVYTASADEAAGVRYLLCHDLTSGDQVWSRAIPGPIERHHAQNSSASGSIAADAHGIYWLWGTRENVRLEAVSHEGHPSWQIDLGPFVSEHGFGGTPTVCGNLIVVPLEQDGPGVVVGIDAVTGKELWRLPREGFGKAAYSTPLVIEGKGTAAVICTSRGHGLYALDPGTGRILWENRCFPRRTVSSPIQAAGLLIGTSGDGGGDNLLVAVRPPDDSTGEATVAYSIGKSVAPYVPTPLESRGRLYLWGDRGVITCVRAADGSQIWKGRVGGSYSSSPIAVGGRIMNVSSEGEIVVIADDDHLDVLGRTPLDEETRATPAVGGGRLLFRSASHLWALPITGHTAAPEADGRSQERLTTGVPSRGQP